MKTENMIPPDIEPRFQQPEGWRWHYFTNPKGQKLRFGAVTPKSRIPNAVVVCLPGLSEYAEKYYEVAHDLLDQNLAFWILDWQGQGQSDRPLSNRQKRHSSDFSNDIDDLHYFLTEYVKHASVHPDVGRIPLVMLAHSMGGNIGMRYLIDHPDMFACAAFSAPMFGIRAARIFPLSIAVAISTVLKEFFNMSYVFGGKDWNPEERETPARNFFSGDDVRAAVHNAWCKADTNLQVGNVTFGWLSAALRSCYRLQQEIRKKPVQIPCLIAIAENEQLVDNTAIRKVAATLPHTVVLDLQESRHEILMEQDNIRGKFMAAFGEMLAANKIREKLKPF